MTLRQYQLIAGAVMLAALAVLVRSLVRETDKERAGKAAAVAVIDRLTLRLDTVQTIAAEAQAAAVQFRRQRDSLLRDARTAKRYAPRQVTAVTLDTADTSDVARGIAALVAERDTAIRDRDSARADTERLRIKLLTLDSIVSRSEADNAARWTRVVTVVDTVHVELHEVRAIVRPRWYRRLGGGLGRAVKVTGVAVIAFAIGRAT